MTFWVSGTTASVDATAVVALADLGVDGAVAVADPELAQAAAFSRNDSIKVCLKNSIAKKTKSFERYSFSCNVTGPKSSQCFV